MEKQEKILIVVLIILILDIIAFCCVPPKERKLVHCLPGGGFVALVDYHYFKN